MDSNCNQPIVISGFAQQPVLTKVIDKIKTGALYSIKLSEDAKVTVEFTQELGLKKLLRQFNDTGFEVDGVKLTLKIPSSLSRVHISPEMLVNIFNRGATRVLRLSHPLGDNSSTRLNPEDLVNLGGVIRVSKLAPDNALSVKRLIFFVEFDHVEASINAKVKIDGNPKFSGWITTFGKDPCGGIEIESKTGKSPSG